MFLGVRFDHLDLSINILCVFQERLNLVSSDQEGFVTSEKELCLENKDIVDLIYKLTFWSQRVIHRV